MKPIQIVLLPARPGKTLECLQLRERYMCMGLHLGPALKGLLLSFYESRFAHLSFFPRRIVSYFARGDALRRPLYLKAR